MPGAVKRANVRVLSSFPSCAWERDCSGNRRAPPRRARSPFETARAPTFPHPTKSSTKQKKRPVILSGARRKASSYRKRPTRAQSKDPASLTSERARRNGAAPCKAPPTAFPGENPCVIAHAAGRTTQVLRLRLGTSPVCKESFPLAFARTTELGSVWPFPRSPSFPSCTWERVCPGSCTAMPFLSAREGNEVVRASVFPSATWERGERGEGYFSFFQVPGRRRTSCSLSRSLVTRTT